MSNNNLKPFPHQLETIQKMKQGKQVVVLPSGSGKTHTVAFHIKNLELNSFLYVVHRDEILNQTIDIFKEILGLQDFQIGIIDAESKQYDKQFLFATIQTLSRDINLEQFNKQIDYLVIDEFHHAAANTYKKIIDYFKPKWLVGLTATPYRMDNKNILDLVDNNIAHNIDLFDAIGKKILVPFHYIGLYDDIDYSEIKHRGFTYNIGDLDRKLIIHKRDEAILKEYRKHIAPEKRLTIGFCNSINHVERITAKFNDAGIKAVGITSNEIYHYRKQKIADFKDGKYSIMFTRDILNEGVDFPECEAILFLRPTMSRTIFFQQLGRGLRKKEGKTDVLVLDFVGNYSRAFEKRQWFSNGKQHEYTGEFTKPFYEYDYPKPVIEFDKQVLDMMELQEHFQGGNVTKELLKEDYLRCCKLENKSQLSSKEYKDSRFRRCSYRSAKILFGSFERFIIESNIPYKSHRVGPIGWMACRNKELLKENYYAVQKEWLATGKKNRYINTQEKCPPSGIMNDPKKSKYNTYCYRKVWGTYRKFLKEIGEITNKPEIVIYDNKEVKDIKTKMFIKLLQEKLNRKYITLTDWRKEYGGLLKTDIEKIGFDKFRTKYGVPSLYILNCLICGKEFKTQYTNVTHQVCSDKCRNKSAWIKNKKPKKEILKQEKLKQVGKCQICGKQYQKYSQSKYGALHPKRRYCSKACANRDHYLRFKHR